ncbi:MAG: hypothetical protein HY904_17625 [Deltaproteobacteria bacterium]|nr:hypothetical protein [Deltaproteobacteria bacterium]
MFSWFGRDRRRTGDVLHVALLILLAVGGLTLAFRTPNAAGLLLFTVVALALWRWHQPLDFLLAGIGVVVGPTLEYFATATGLWTYPYPSLGRLPLWVFALWPAFPVCLVRLTFALVPPDGKHRRHLALEVGAGLAVLALEIPLLCTFGTAQPAWTLAGTVVLLAPIAFLMRGVHAALMLLISGIVGPLCESLPVAMGAWGYPNPDILGLPMWLPTGYALFGFAMVRLALGADAWLSARAPRPGALDGAPAL